jgi:hypothetical protein
MTGFCNVLVKAGGPDQKYSEVGRLVAVSNKASPLHTGELLPNTVRYGVESTVTTVVFELRQVIPSAVIDTVTV